MPRAAPAGAHHAARLIFFCPRHRSDGRENGVFMKTRPGSRYVGGPVGLAEIYCQNGGDRNSGRFLCWRMEGGRERNARARKSLAMADCAMCAALMAVPDSGSTFALLLLAFAALFDSAYVLRVLTNRFRYSSIELVSPPPR